MIAQALPRADGAARCREGPVSLASGWHQLPARLIIMMGAAIGVSARLPGLSQLEGAEQFVPLQPKQEPSVTRIAMIVPLVEGTGERARALVGSDPPLDPAALAIEKQEVFVTDTEIAFVFETTDRGILERLAGPTSWVAGPEWREIVAGKPHVAQVGYSWSRPDDETTGLAFKPTPGPGYSEGGDVFAP